MARFSERIGVKPPKTVLQLNSMDDDLRNGLWNVCMTPVLENGLPRSGFLESTPPAVAAFITRLWVEGLGQPFDEIPLTTRDTITKIRNRCFKAGWAGMYDFVEFVVTIAPGDKGALILECNQVLERERSGYRIVNATVTAISAPEEMSAVQTASELEGPFAAVGIHTRTAIEQFSDRKAPDYRNSIKESISAVEAMCKIVTGDEKATLNTALKQLEKAGIPLHPALKQGFDKLYAYTGDADGIRHALLEESTLDFDDAKFMLVSCSAFVNYLAAKASKAGVLAAGK
jgi:hypothetical protein